MRTKFHQKNSGFTLIELMVALALSLIIAAAAIASLVIARQGFSAVDASSQLRDNSRFASDLIQRLVVQSGYQSTEYSAATRGNAFVVKGAATNPEPHILGADNALLKTSGAPNIVDMVTSRAGATSTASKCSSSIDTACANGSDVLVIRYQSSSAVEGSAIADGTMINCAGIPETTVPTDKQDRIVSIFHVAKSSTGSEPSLSCTFRDSTGNWITRPVVEGVESFQVMYGVDGFTTGVNTQFTGPEDSVPDKYLRANQMVVGNDPQSAATYSNWRRVRSVRIGLVLRGALNTDISKSGIIPKYCPLGALDASTASTCIDESGTETPPMGSEFPRKNTSLVSDGRLRQATNFTIYLRNFQNNN